jgi:hypothetical protein
VKGERGQLLRSPLFKVVQQHGAVVGAGLAWPQSEKERGASGQ